MGVVFRPADEGDLGHVKWALYTAVAWDPKRPVPPFEVTIDHPQLALYHRHWMRPGDVGVVAESEGAVVGVAFCRLFTADDHGHGYVDDDTPEIAVAVAEGHRGDGLGRRPLDEVAAGA